MKLKFDENGAVTTVEKEGVAFPVYVDDDGKDIDVDVPNLFAKVAELSSEAKTRRQEKNALQERLDLFKDIEDLPTWKENAEKAMQTVKNYDDKKLVDAGKVEQVKQSVIEAKDEEIRQIHESYKGKISEQEQTIVRKDSQIYELAISNKFSQSPLFNGPNRKYNIPADMAEAKFSRQIRLEEGKDGKLREVGYKLNGEPIYSRKTPGELAFFNEFMPEIIDEYPKKDEIIETMAGSGSGGGSGQGSLTGVDAKIANLKAQYQEAINKKDSKTAITLKNRIFTLEAQRSAGSRA